MPYHLVKVGKGWKVATKEGRTLSKKPLSRAKAERQKRAVEINEGLKNAP